MRCSAAGPSRHRGDFVGITRLYASTLIGKTKGLAPQVVLALLSAFAYGFAKLVERYGGVGDRPSPCEEWSNPDCSDPSAPPSEPKP